MGAELELSPVRLVVDPGGRAETQITVRNTGSVVDSFTLEVLGDAADWCVCEPATLSIFPGQEAGARLVATPPAASELPPGPVPYAVKAISSEDPAGSVVEEGVLDVGGVALVQAELSPRTSRARGKRAGRHQVAVDNRGNTPVVVRLTGLDDEDQVRVVCDPPELEVAAGAAAFAKVRVRAEHRFWRGPSQTRRFHVVAQPPGDEPTRMDASLLQEAAVPGWLPRALALLLVAAVALTALWFTLLKPAVKDAATSAGTAAAQSALSSALQSANAAARSGPAGSVGAAAGGTSSASASPSGSSSGASPSASPTLTLPAPISFVKDLSSGNSVSAGSTQQLTITDVVLQNPAGDTGVLTITDGGTVIMTTQLADFRNYDLHFITPITVPSGQSLTMSVKCQDPAGATCSAATLVSGMQYTTS